MSEVEKAKATVIYLEDRMILSKKEYTHWREVQDEYPTYKTSLVPLTCEEIIGFFEEDFKEEEHWPFSRKSIIDFFECNESVILESMYLILEYVEAVKEMDKITNEHLGDMREVRRGNRLGDRNRKIASEIEKKHPEMKPAFYQLIFHENASVRRRVAHHILELMNYENEYRKKALSVIVDVAEHSDGIEGLGNQMWLKMWLDEHPEDKELL